MIYVQANQAFEAVTSGWPTGLTGTLGVRVIDNTGTTVVARATAGVAEYPAGMGIYSVTLTAPAAAGQFTVVWDDAAGHTAIEDLLVGTILPVPAAATGAYAGFGDVQARAGRMAGSLSVAGQHPNQTDVEQFLADTAAEIDAAIRARGFDPASIDDTTKQAFRDLNAYGALYRAMAAMSNPPPDLISEARSIWEAAMGTPQDPRGTIARGTFPAIAVLEAGGGGGGAGASAGALWTEEPNYGTVAWAESEYWRLRGTNFAPTVTRGQKL